MAIEAQLPDGRILEFPDGTDPEVIQSAAKRLMVSPLSHVSTEELKNAPSAPFSVSDIARSGGTGVVGGLGSLAAVGGASSAPSKYLEEKTQGIQSGLSPARLAEMQRREELIRRAEESGSFFEKIKAGAGAVTEAPLQSLAQGLGSAVTPVAAAVAAVAMAPASLAAGIGVAAAAVVGGLMGAGESKKGINERVRQEFEKAGDPPDVAARKADEAQAWTGQNLDQIMINAGTGALEGATGVGRVAAGAARTARGLKPIPTKPLTAPTKLGTVAGAAVEEAAPELIQSLAGTAAGNVAASRAGFQADTFEGATSAATRDALIGALTGAAVSPVQYKGLQNDFLRQQQDEANKKQEEFQKQREEFVQKYQQQQEETKKNLGLNMLALPAPATTAEEKYRNPAATITRDELGEQEVNGKKVKSEALQYLDDYRKANNLPALKAYSIEDIQDAMPGLNPEGEKGILDSILAGKYGYKPVDETTGNEIKYTSDDIMALAEEEKNIATGTQGFKDFLTSVTGTDNVGEMSQPQLHAAYSALQKFEPAEETRILPEGTAATRFSQKQYDNALKVVNVEFASIDNKPLDPKVIAKEIKESTGLENDRDALALLDTAVKNGDLTFSTKPVFRVVDPATGQFVHTALTRAKAEKFASGKNLNIIGDSQSYISPAEQDTLPDRTPLPAGYQINQERVVEGEEDLVDVMREGKGQSLDTIAADKAQERIDTLTGESKELAAKALKRIESDSAMQKRIQKNLDQMVAKGEGKTSDFKIQKTRSERAITNLRLRIEKNLAKIEELSAPIKTRKSEVKKPIIKKKLTVTKDGKAIGTFSNKEIDKANAQAQDAILTQMTDEEIQAAIDDKKLGLFREKAKKEQDIRRGPTGFKITKAKVPETLAPEFVDKAEEIKKTLVPMLQRFGLGNVGLNIVNAIKNNAEGSYLNSLIQVAFPDPSDPNAANPVQTMRHEALHALRDLGFFTDSQWQALTNKAKSEWIQKYLKNQNVEVDGRVMSRYDGYVYINQTEPAAWNKANPDKPARAVMSDAALNELLVEEAIADAFGDFDANGSPAGMVAAILKRLNQLFEALRNSITGAGFQTAEDIFGKVERGELKGTKEATSEEKLSARAAAYWAQAGKVVKGVTNEMDLTEEEFESTSLMFQTGKAGTEQFKSEKIGGLPEVVQFLQDQRRKSGLPLLSVDKPEDRKVIARLMATEAMAAIRSGGANLEWYDSIINKTLAMAGLKYSELNTDINARMAFRIATAITSQGLNVEDNLAFAMKVYDQFRQFGKFPEIGQGADQAAMISNFKLANYLLDDMKADLMRQFLETEFTVEEMRSAGFSVTGELGDEKVLGSSVFGPKIGFGFYSNLNGNFDPVTMDMWFMRTIGRLTGNLKAFKQDLYDAQLDKFRNELDTSGSNGVFADQFNQDEIDLAKADDKAAEALARKVKSAHERDYKANRASYNDGTREKSKLVATSETMIKSLDAPKDAPSNGTERRNLRDVVRQMVDIVEEKYGKRVPPASLQAVIWYPEQELYKAMGVKLRVTSQNYAGAIEKILLGEGYGEGNLSAAAKLGSRTAQQLAKTAVVKGSKATGTQPVRLGALQAEEKESLLERGRKRVVLEEEKVTPKRKKVIFEVAPDPNNKALTAKWNALPNEVRIEISDRIGNKIIKDALDKFGIKGYVDTQVGSYLDDTNPSFALYLESGDPVAMANFLGYALSQDSMMVVSPKEAKGLDKTGAVRVNIGNASAKKVNEIYQQLREIEVDGEKPIGGQSFMNGHMVVLNYSNVPTNELAVLINDKLEQQYEVITEDVYTAFPEKKDYDYANPSSDPRGNAGVLRQTSRDLRSEATRLLQKELRGFKPEAAPAEGKLSLRSTRQPPESKEFKQWFGNSYFTSGGEPLIMYHGTARDITIFKGKQAKAIFVTTKPDVAEDYANMGVDYMRTEAYKALTRDEKAELIAVVAEQAERDGKITKVELKEIQSNLKKRVPPIDPEKNRIINLPYQIEGEIIESLNNLLPTKGNIMPVYVNARNVFDYANKDHVNKVYEWMMNNSRALGRMQNPEQWLKKIKDLISRGNWVRIESEDVQEAIRALDFDGFSVLEAGSKNYAVYNPTNIKSVTGNIGTFGLGEVTSEQAKQFGMTAEQAKQAQEEGDIRFSLRKAPDTPEFKRWFGKSKVVDENGDPLIVFHTGAFDANEIISAAEQYRRTYGKSSGYMQGGNEGIYFSADPLYSSLYGKREGKTMYPVYLSIKNPFVVENKEQMSRLVKLKNFILGKREVFRNSIISDTTDPSTDSMYITPEYKAELIKRGYDGIVNKEHNEIVAFEPTQIKSAIGNRGTYDFTNPDIRYSLKSTLPANIAASIEKTTTVREEKGFAERMMEAISPKGFSSWRAEAINRYNALSIADKIKVKKRGGVALYADQSAEAAALMSDNAAGVAASAMGVHDRRGGVPVFRNGVTTIDGSVEGIVSIFAPLAKYKDPFVYQMYQFYSGAKRARRYLDKGIEKNYDANDIAYAEQLGKDYPEFKQIFEKWDKYNKGLVKYQVDTGVLSPAEGAEYIKYADYVPFYRQLEGEKTFGPNVFQSISGVKKPKKYTGGEAPIADFMETIVRNTQSAIQAGMKNTAAKMAVDTFVEIDQAELAPDGSTGEEYVHVLEGGVKKSYLVYDKALVQSVMSLNLPELPFIGFFAGPANLLRNLVTKDPGFMLANMVRDSMSAWVTSGVKMTPVASAIKNFTGALAGTAPEYQALLNAGVLGGYDYSQGVEVSAASMKKALGKYAPSTSLDKLKNVPTSLWESLEKGTMASDAATRMEVYKSVLAETGNEAEALYRAMEVMNFNRKGRSAVVRVLTAAVPFLNARIQGLDVLYRAMSGQMGTSDAKKIQKAFFVRGASIMAMSMIYWALTHDEEEYKKQEQETRDNYWLIPSMGIKIPIPFEVGVIFKVIPERIAEYFLGNDTGKDFADSMKRNFMNTFAFNLIPQTVLPIYEAKTNYSFFTQRNIIGAGLEGVAPEYQVGPSTSQLAAFLGKELGYSPMLIDHVIGGYTGTFGSYAVDVIDAIAFAGADVQRPSKRFEQLPIFKRFLLDPQAKGNVTAYYDLKNSVDEAVRTSNFLEKTSNFEELGKYNEETLKVLASKDFISDMEKDMKELREMSTFVRSSTMSPDDKRDMLMSITDAENAMTANVRYLRKLMD
jgi:hypothetical protein